MDTIEDKAVTKLKVRRAYECSDGVVRWIAGQHDFGGFCVRWLDREGIWHTQNRPNMGDILRLAVREIDPPSGTIRHYNDFEARVDHVSAERWP